MKENGFVLDVNIWVSFVLGKQMGWLAQKVKSKEIEIFYRLLIAQFYFRLPILGYSGVATIFKNEQDS